MSHRQPVAGMLVILVGLAALVGCGGGGPSASPGGSATAPSSASPPSASAGAASAGASSFEERSPGAGAGGQVWLPEWSDGDAPDVVANRRPLPFCGVEKAPAPQPGEFIDRAVRLCFWNAQLAKTEAEYVSIQTTMEGSPFAVIYRLASDGTVEVFTDFTQDAFGGNAWLASLCERVVEGEGNALIGVAGCTPGEPLD